MAARPVGCGQLLGIYQDIVLEAGTVDTFVDEVKSALPNIDSLSLGTLKCMEINSLFANAQLERVDRGLADASMLMRQGRSILGLNYCYVHACVAALYKCDFENADVHIKLAFELAENNFGADSGLKYIASTLKFAIMVWSGRADQSDLKGFVASLADLEEHDGWTEIYLIGLDAGYHLAAANSDWATAYAIIERYESVAAIRALGRLKQSCLALKCEAEFNVGHDHNSRSIVHKIKEYEADNKWPKNWQGHVVSAIKRSSLEMDDDAVIEAALKDVSLKSKAAGAHFHNVRIVAELCDFYLRRGDETKSLEALAELVELCAGFEFFWPFKFNPSLKSALYSMRDDMNLTEGSTKRVFVDKFLSGQFERQNVNGPNILSLRERQVLTHLAHGLSNKEIAIKLDLTDNTVKFHLKNIYTKLSVSRRGEAVFEAKHMGLI